MNFKSIEIRNFQACKELDIEFAKHTYIVGMNGTGKTTVLDAIKWCLFGKDSENKTQFDIRFYDAEGNVSEEDVSVLLNIEDNGVLRAFSRVLKGSVNSCFIDGVQYKVADYSAIVGKLVESEERFKMLTDPLYIFTLNWKDQRETVMNFFPVPDESLVLATKDFSDKFIARLKKLTPEQMILSNRELSKTLTKKRSETEGQIKLLNTFISDDTSDLDLYETERTMLQEKLVKANAEIDSNHTNNETIRKAKEIVYDCNAKLERMKMIAEARRDRAILDLTNELNWNKAEKKRLTELYKSMNVVDTKCPVCKKDYSIEEVGKLTEQVNADKKVIVDSGRAVNARIAEIEKILENPDSLFSYTEAENSSIKDCNEQKAEQALYESAKIVDLSELLKDKDKLVARLEEVNRILGKKDLIAENTEKKKNLNAFLLQIIEQLETAENITNEALDYISARTSIVADAVNKSFKTIKINLTEAQKNGTVIDAFEISRNGVPYSALNTGSRLLVGIELVEFLKSKLGIEAPIMFDDAERYDTKLLKSIDCQTILAMFKDEKELTIVEED